MLQNHIRDFSSYKEWANFADKWKANPISVEEKWYKKGLTLVISFSFANKSDERIYIGSLSFRKVWNF